MTTLEQLRMSDIAIQQVAPVAQSTLFWLLIGASEFDAEVISQERPEESCCYSAQTPSFCTQHARASCRRKLIKHLTEII